MTVTATIPYVYKVVGVEKGARRAYSKLFADEIAVRIPELADQDAPIAFAARDRQGDRVHLHRSLDGRPLLPLDAPAPKRGPAAKRETPMLLSDLRGAAADAKAGRLDRWDGLPHGFSFDDGGLRYAFADRDDVSYREIVSDGRDAAAAAATSAMADLVAIDGELWVGGEHAWNVEKFSGSIATEPYASVSVTGSDPTRTPRDLHLFRLDRVADALACSEKVKQGDLMPTRCQEVEDSGLIRWTFDDARASLRNAMSNAYSLAADPSFRQMSAEGMLSLCRIRDALRTEVVDPAERLDDLENLMAASEQHMPKLSRECFEIIRQTIKLRLWRARELDGAYLTPEADEAAISLRL